MKGGTVFEDQVRVTVALDLDTDSNNNNFVEKTNRAEDDIEDWKGIDVTALWGNSKEDRTDPSPFVDSNGNPVMDNDLEPVNITVDGGESDLTGYTVEIVVIGTNVKLWKTQDKQPLPSPPTYTIGANPALPSTIYVEGFDYGTDQLDLILKSPSGAEVGRDQVMFTVLRIDLTGYRPQTQTYGAPFARFAVPFSKEQNPGVGIRRNGDDDDNNGVADKWQSPGPVANENDLIEVERERNWQPYRYHRYVYRAIHRVH